MSHPTVTLAAIRETRTILGDRIHHTPMLSSATAARVAGHHAGATLADGRLYLKAEHLQKTGSFKARAALARISSLTPDERRRGAITISAGNAGQAYAWAAREAGVPMTVVMPAGAVPSKVAACLEYGAEVVLHGEHVGESLERLEELREERDLVLVHPYDDPEVLLGNGSCGLEIHEDLPDLDVLVIGVGGGGLMGGVAVAIRELRPRTRIYAVEPVGSDALRQGLAAGQPVRFNPRSIADGLNAPSAGHLALDVARRYLEGAVTIEDATILAGLRFSVERLKQVLEPAGAAALAAVLTGSIPIRDGDRVAVILSGGNVAPDRLGGLLADAAPDDGAPLMAGEGDAAAGLPEARIDGIPDGPPAGPPLPPPPTWVPFPPPPPARPMPPPSARPVVRPIVSEAVLAIPLGTREAVRQSLDLLTRRDTGLRGASFYIGLMLLVTVGPVVVLLGLALTLPGVGDALINGYPMPADDDSAWPAWALLAMVPAFLGYLAASVEARSMATAVIGGRVEGRPLRLRESIGLARRRFWVILGAQILVGILATIASGAVQSVVTAVIGPVDAVLFGVSLVVSVLVSAPFVYVAAGIILGEVGVLEAIARSVRLVGLRKRLAVVVTLFGVLGQFIVLFGLSIGLDTVARVLTSTGLVEDFPRPLVIPIVAALVFALGTLTFLVESIGAAPAVHAFAALTHYTHGLEQGRERPVRGRSLFSPWFTPGLAVGALVALIALVGGVLALPA